MKTGMEYFTEWCNSNPSVPLPDLIDCIIAEAKEDALKEPERDISETWL